MKQKRREVDRIAVQSTKYQMNAARTNYIDHGPTLRKQRRKINRENENL